MTSQLDQIEDGDTLVGAMHYCTANLARFCGITERHLQRYFWARLGMPPGHRFTILRLNRPAALILSGCTVKAASLELGWKISADYRMSINQTRSRF